jgi:hypothetical protein
MIQNKKGGKKESSPAGSRQKKPVHVGEKQIPEKGARWRKKRRPLLY